MEKPRFDGYLTFARQKICLAGGPSHYSGAYLLSANQVQQTRQALELSQTQFAALVHVSVKTLQNWEQGVRSPAGAAAALLTAIRNDPEHVIAALNSDCNVKEPPKPAWQAVALHQHSYSKSSK
jgi:putative transcriptional regulator